MSHITEATTRRPRAFRTLTRGSLAVGGILAMVVSFAPAAAATPFVRADDGAQYTVVTPPESSLDCSADPPKLNTVGDPWPQQSGFVQDVDWIDSTSVTVAFGITDGTTLNGKPAVFAQSSTWVFVQAPEGVAAVRVLTCDDPTGQHTADELNGNTAPSTPVLPDNASRIAGANRYETAAKVATGFGTAGAVVVANGTTAKDGVDALAANYLAGRVGAPILLTQATRTDSATLGAIKAVLKGATDPVLYVMGGTDSVSDAVVAQLKAAAASTASGAVTVKRIAGANRYATSASVATTPGAVTNSLTLGTGSGATTAILVSGEVNADALAAGPLSYAWGVPVLLTPSGQLPSDVAGAIKSLGITQLIVLGGADRVPQAVLDQATAAGVVSVKRIAGADRFDTAAQLYGFAADTLQDSTGSHYGAGGTTAYLANGATGFPDALAAGPLAGKNGDVLLTVQQGKLGASTQSFLKSHHQFGTIVGLGSAAGSVSDAVIVAAATAAG